MNKRSTVFHIYILNSTVALYTTHSAITLLLISQTSWISPYDAIPTINDIAHDKAHLGSIVVLVFVHMLHFWEDVIDHRIYPLAVALILTVDNLI